MEEQLVSRPVAILAKGKGFDIECKYWYNMLSLGGILIEKGSPYDKSTYNSYKNECAIYVPTQALLQKFLREKHNLHIVISVDFYPTGINYLVQVLIYDPNDTLFTGRKSTGQYGDNNEFPTFEEALEFGLQKALELI